MFPPPIDSAVSSVPCLPCAGPAHRRRRAPLAAFAVAAGLLLASASFAGTEPRLIALSGRQAPGATPGVLFSELRQIGLDPSGGRVAFTSSLTGGSILDDGVWYGGTPILVPGSPAPGPYSDLTVDSASLFGVLGGDLAVFLAFQEEPGEPVLLVGRPGSFATALRLGVTSPPGFPEDVTMHSQGTQRVNRHGEVFMTRRYSGPGTSGQGAWVWSGGTWTEIVLAGGAAPGTSHDLRALYTNELVFNDDGVYTFVAWLEDAADTYLGHALYRGSGGTITKIAALGDSADGGGSFVEFEGLAARNGHGVAFIGETTTGRNLYLADGSGPPVLLAEVGTILPGGLVLDLVFDPAINVSNQVAFRGQSNGSTDFVLLKDGPGPVPLEVLARTGDPAPGFEEGVEIADVYTNPALSDFGLVVFMGRVTGPGIDTTNDRALWARHPNGSTLLVARQGDTWNVDGEPRTVGGADGLGFLGVSAGWGGEGNLRSDAYHPLDGDCNIAFWAEFTDGTNGIFVSTIPFCQLLSSGFESGDLSDWGG